MIDQELAGQLRDATFRLARQLRQLASDGVSLSPSQMAMLVTVEKHGPLSLGELAAIEKVAKPTVTAVVGKLEEQEFVRRLADPHDGRVSRIELTARGRRHMAALRQRRNEWLWERLAALSPDELAALAADIPALEALARHEEAGES